LGITNLVLGILLKFNLLVFGVFMILGLGVLLFGMYNAYTVAKKINRREIAFTCKSRLFWLPVIVLVAIMVLLIASLAVASLVFGMAGNFAHANPTPPLTPLPTPFPTLVQVATPVTPFTTTQDPSLEIASDTNGRVAGYDQEVTLVSIDNSGTITPGTDTQLVSFKVTIKNTGSEILYVSDSDFVIIDADGNQFNSLSKTDISYGWSEELRSNTQITRLIVFNLPKNISQSELCYNFGSNGAGGYVATWNYPSL
jgi:hypothetical protein